MLGGHKQVLVLGAGTAGLAAAHDLIQAGINDVLILEASHRIGGRVWTTEFGKDVDGNQAEFGKGVDGNQPIVELGANWIHGAAHNPVYKLAQEKGLLDPFVLLDREAGHYYSEDGRRLDKDLGDKLWQRFMVLEEKTDIFYDNNIQTSMNQVDYFTTKLAAEMDAFAPKDRPDLEIMANAMLTYLSFHVGDDLRLLSLQYDGAYEDIPGGDVKLALGFTGVVRSLTNNFEPDTIKLGTAVTQIQWDGLDCPVNVSCITNHGQEAKYTCDHIVVTCSLGVLKKAVENKALFRPQLPADKREAVNKIGFGTVNKIFMHYDQPFWSPGSASVKLAWSGDYTDVDEEKEWYRRIYSFDEVMDNPSVLVAWISGRAAVHVETLSDEEVGQTCTTILRQFLNNSDVPEPSRILRSSWHSNPLTLGSYSYNSMNSTPDDISSLAEPLYNQNRKPAVLFAGEATHVRWYSTVHGALDSGKREADRLIQYLTN